MKIALIALAALTVAVAANAQNYGTISRPDILGDRHFQYSNGVSGTISRPDILGDQHISYSNPYSQPNYGFGGFNQFNQQRTMPRGYNPFNQ